MIHVWMVVVTLLNVSTCSKCTWGPVKQYTEYEPSSINAFYPTREICELRKDWADAQDRQAVARENLLVEKAVSSATASIQTIIMKSECREVTIE